MKLQLSVQSVLFAALVALMAWPAPTHAAPAAQAQNTAKVRVTGVVRDEQNAITLPGVTVEVVGRDMVTYTDGDGRYLLDLVPGTYELKISADAYSDKTVMLDVPATGRMPDVNVPLAMMKFAESVVVTAQAIEAQTSTVEAQLIERKQSAVVSDNMGGQEMKSNGDGNAAQAMGRVTGLSVVDNQFVFVRGLGERYSNTTLSGSVVPTTEPDKKVVALDIFPSGLLDSIQIAKTYSPDKSAEFAGGLVQIVPLKLPSRPVGDVSFGFNLQSTATGKDVPFGPLNGHDYWGYDGGARALPSGFPSGKVVRRGIYTPEVGYSNDEINTFGRLLDNSALTPVNKKGKPGTNWAITGGNRFGKVGLIGSINQSYKETYVEENRKFFPGADLTPVSDYDFKIGTQKAELGVLGNIAVQFNPGNRLGFENFYSHSGRDEARSFQGNNNDAVLEFRDYRLQYVEEGLITNALTGSHNFRSGANNLIDWRVQSARADRNEPDLRETLYQRTQGTNNPFVLADESQSGFRLFNELNDDTVDGSLSWSLFSTVNGQPVQWKFGPGYVRRTRDFSSRRFRYVPSTGISSVDLTKNPEQLYTSQNIGTAFRLLETTRPTDAYDAKQTTGSFFGMTDWALSVKTRLVAGVRVEKFTEEVNSFDPFGLFVEKVQAKIDNTDVFPSVNFVVSPAANQNLRVAFSQTANRPEFRELAAFEFTDVIGNRAIRGNPDLQRALIQNVDVRYEAFTGSRGVLAASVFYKHFTDPIERVINAGAEPLATFENAKSARNVGLEFEAARQFGDNFFASANYSFVDSKITLSDSAIRVQTSQERALAGQSKNLFNMAAEVSARGFSGRVLVNVVGARISDVGAGGAPDVIENGRASLDMVFSQRIANSLNIRLTLDNLTDTRYLFTQGDQDQRRYKVGRAIGLSFGYSFY